MENNDMMMPTETMRLTDMMHNNACLIVCTTSDNCVYLLCLIAVALQRVSHVTTICLHSSLHMISLCLCDTTVSIHDIMMSTETMTLTD